MSGAADDRELAISMEAPGFHIDRFYVVARGETVRVAFAEVGPNGPNYRSAVVMTRANAEKLAALVQRCLQKPGQTPTGSGGAPVH